jgi:DNA-binding MarR family transcriptional regulator
MIQKEYRMIEQFKFDIRLIFAILNGKVSAAINRKLSRNFRQNGVEITPEQWTVLLFLWEKDGVTQQELCNATYKDKPSMTRLIDNMERLHLVVRISDKKDRRTNLIHLTKTGRDLEEKSLFIANKTLKEALRGLTLDDLKVSQEVLRKVFSNTKD